METETRIKLSPKSRSIFDKFCANKEIHCELNVTYKDVADRVLSWLYKQPVPVWNEVIKILETELAAAEDKCFTGRLSRLVSCLDGFHPGVRVTIASSDQISNRVLAVIQKAKEENLSKEETLKRARAELAELEMSEKQIDEWMVTVEETLD